MVVVSEGSFNITDGSCSHQLGVLSPSDILNAEILPAGSYSRSNDVYGGKFEKLKSFLSSAHNFIKSNKLISKGLKLIPHPYAQTASNISEQLGYGYSGGSIDDYGGGIDDFGGRLNITNKKPKKHKNLSDLA